MLKLRAGEGQWPSKKFEVSGGRSEGGASTTIPSTAFGFPLTFAAFLLALFNSDLQSLPYSSPVYSHDICQHSLRCVCLTSSQ